MRHLIALSAVILTLSLCAFAEGERKPQARKPATKGELTCVPYAKTWKGLPDPNSITKYCDVSKPFSMLNTEIVCCTSTGEEVPDDGRR